MKNSNEFRGAIRAAIIRLGGTYQVRTLEGGRTVKVDTYTDVLTAREAAYRVNARAVQS